MSLHPQDVLVALKLALDREPASYAQLGHALGLSPSQAHAAVKRAEDAGLLVPDKRRVNRRALIEFLVHGLKYVFPAKKGPVERGVPTAHAAPPLSELLSSGDAPIVWADPEGDVRGESLEPLYKSAPHIARSDKRLYEALALIDGIRAGRARERKIASERLTEMIRGAG